MRIPRSAIRPAGHVPRFRHGGRGVARHVRSGGFTLLEMLVVAALIGILALLAMPNYRHATQKARESVLREDLWILRDVIDQYHTDKGKYPSSLEDLGKNGSGYLRKVPVDPITGSAETWQTDTEPIAEDAPADTPTEQGITDVHSGAPGTGSDGIAYADW